MANKGIHSYTVQEGTNAGLGQGGSMLFKGGTAYTAPTGQSFISITILTDNLTFSNTNFSLCNTCLLFFVSHAET